jgi:N-carbamoyl-L-amino-acid hydrolase
MGQAGATKAAALAVDEQRLWRRLIELAKIGGLPNGGTDRQALTPQEADARRLIAIWASELKCSLYIDDIANLFIRREGTDPAAAPVITGSHIDTQPTGGKFDGNYGVLAGLEVLQILNEAQISTRRPIEVAIWTNEEGCRFAPGMMGSEAFAGTRSLADIVAVRDAAGVSVADALPAILAATPSAQKRPVGFPIAAFIETHIEQGPILEAENRVIGVVTGIQGTRRFRVEVVGEEAHAGTTPRSQRRDAMAAAAHMVVAVQQAVEPYQEDVRFTVGMWNTSPNVPGVIAGKVLFSIDLRHPDSTVLKSLGDDIEAICKANAQGCKVTVGEIANAKSIHFSDKVVELVRGAAARHRYSHMDIFSGAGHDARQLHYVCPTGMIFVPCERGISHNEAENAKPAHLAAGTHVLIDVLLELADS